MTLTEQNQNKKVVVIGGGITGLTAIYYLQKEIKEKNLPIDVILIEASHRLGGKIQTVTENGYVIERGPDSFLARKTSAARLASEVGLENQLVNNSTGKSYVLVDNELHPMPGGSVMGIPTQMGPFVTTGLFSLQGKMRAAADFVLPRSNVKGDQSLGQFFRRRLGNEVVENLIEPLLSGIYAGDIDKLSLKATFPQFHQVEQKHRSLILGMKKTTPKPQKNGNEPEKKKGVFLTIKSGLQSFVDRIESKLDPNSVIKGVKIDSIVQSDGDSSYILQLNNGEVMKTDSVIVTTPHQAVQSMFSHYDFFEHLKEMPSTSVATVAMGFDEKAIKQDIDGTGFVVSRNSDYTITACTWTHKKWEHSTPKGKVLLRCYVGRAGDEAIVDLSDEQIEQIVLEDLKKIMDISMSPEFTIVSRWKDAMPQYTVGHKQRYEEMIKNVEHQLPGIFIAGSSFEGLGLPDCIDQGEKAVSNVLGYLNK